MSVCLLTIFVQDLKTRSVHWSLFVLVFFIALLGTHFFSLPNVFTNWLLNLAFIAFLLAGLTLYLSLRMKRFVNITKGFFSWGDILFLVAISPLFFLLPFIYFFTFGTLLSLVYYVLLQRFVSDRTVPYAGFMALNTFFVLIARFLHLPHIYSFRP